MTIQQFRGSPALTAGLAEVLSNKTLKTALDTIKEDSLMRTPPPAVPGVHQDTTNTHFIYRQMGVLHVIDTLNRMTRDNRTQADDEEEFSHAIPEELRPKTK